MVTDMKQFRYNNWKKIHKIYQRNTIKMVLYYFDRSTK